MSTTQLFRGFLSSPALLALIAFPFLALLSLVVHQLYFHPLAKYPGPLLGRITRLYDLYHAYKGDKHILLYQLHQKYGTVVRFTPNTISINDPAALKAIYSHGANVTKNEFYKVGYTHNSVHISRLLTRHSASVRHHMLSAHFWPPRKRTMRRSDASPDRPSPRQLYEDWRSTSSPTRRR